MLKNEIIHRLELLKSKEIDTLTIGNNFFLNIEIIETIQKIF